MLRSPPGDAPSSASSFDYAAFPGRCRGPLAVGVLTPARGLRRVAQVRANAGGLALSRAGAGPGPRTSASRSRGRARRSARRRRARAARSPAATGGGAGRSRRRRSRGTPSRKWRESVKPGSTTGTVAAPGSCSATQPAIASISSPATGELLPTTCSVKSRRQPSSGPSTAATSSRTSRSPSPGGTRQSTFSSARLGITLTFSEALICVGVNVTPSIGSKNTARRSSCGAQARDRAGGVRRVLADAREERAAARRSGGSRAGARRSARAAAPIFSSAFSPIAGIEAWPATPLGGDREAEHALLRAADAVAAPAAVLEERRPRPR